jgi:hypothetical protein
VPPSLGDTSVLGYRVLDAAGKRLGSMSAICVSTDRRGREVDCTGLMRLADGDITLQGSGDPLAVTGGTGAYAGARGIAEGHDQDGRTDLTLTFMP